MRLSKTSILQSLIFVFIGLYVGIGISVWEGKNDDRTDSISSNNLRQYARSSDHNDNNADIREQLKHSREEIKRLKALTQSLNSKQGSFVQKIKTLEDSCQAKDESTPTTSRSKANTHPICKSIMPHPVPTAMDIWNQHILKILSASRMHRDRQFAYHDFTTQLLQIITPRLPRSVKTAPFDWRPVESALTVAWERYRYLQLPKEERDEIEPRPLKVLVMGGSLLVGTNCGSMNREMGFTFGMPWKECNWSSRLENFLNNFFLGFDHTEKLIDLTKVAMGGTNTATGSVIWQYDLIPEQARNPDIVINAYSTNDMHIVTVLEAQSSNTTLRDKTFEMIEKFVRQVLGSKKCTSTGDQLIPPLLLHVDDYLGNEQRKIWETTELTQGVQLLANYYGFVSLSYADVIREFVYGDTYESWFSSEWWVPEGNQKSLNFQRHIHPGMGMHISSMWVAAYNLLHLASSYCSMPTAVVDHLGSNNITDYRADLWGLPELKNEHKQPKGKPRPRPEGLPPALTKDLLLEDVTSLWRNQSSEQQSKEASSFCKSNDNSLPVTVKCPFSWVSGLSLQQNNATWVQEYFETQSSIWEGWELSKDEKLGFIPSEEKTSERNSRMVLDFAYSQSIQSITIFYMKSYGTKWENSELEAKIWFVPSANPQSKVLLEERKMLGIHNKNTSEMYTEEVLLQSPVNAGEKIQLEATLVGGETFKIMGLAVCS